MTDLRIAVVDDEPAILDSIRDYFDTLSIVTHVDPQRALEDMRGRRFDILVCDYRMPGLSGLDLLRQARQLGAYRYGILLTAYADKDILVAAINDGLVMRVIEKPLHLEVLAAALADAQVYCSSERIRELDIEEAARLYRECGRDSVPLCERIVGLEGGLSAVFADARRFAATRENVLVTGETGTGKEVIARLIHSLSERRSGPFVKINCGAIPETLVESELFGHAKGAFSGAQADRMGRIETARGGTLFLDEIAEMRLDMQAKLLAVLQDKGVERVGSNERRPVDFRLVCATNRDLDREVREGRFRKDLFFRIGTLQVRLPALRDRRVDILNLAHAIIASFCRELGRRPPGMDRSSIDTLLAYPWPGNIRELENVLKRAVVLTDPARPTIESRLLECLSTNSAARPDPAPPPDLESALSVLTETLATQGLTLREVETRLLGHLLARFGGSVPLTSRKTGIPKDRFYRLGKGPK